MEEWQQWQIRADENAAALRQDVDALERDFFTDAAEQNFRGFWPRFRDLKERVRTAPAIRLEDKLDLERRLRGLGSKAYKAQEAIYAQSAERKNELLAAIQAVRAAAETAEGPRNLRDLRRELDALREQFDKGIHLMPADRQAVWEAWRDTNNFVWERLNALWGENEAVLREVLATAHRAVENKNANAARQAVGRFFEMLRTHEAKQAVVNSLKAEADAIRREATEVEQRRTAERFTSRPVPTVPLVETWRSDYDRNRDLIARLLDEVAELERRFQETESILEQAMIRGTLVDKRRKLAELESTNRDLEQRIEQTEETPLISTG